MVIEINNSPIQADDCDLSLTQRHKDMISHFPLNSIIPEMATGDNK